MHAEGHRFDPVHLHHLSPSCDTPLTVLISNQLILASFFNLNHSGFVSELGWFFLLSGGVVLCSIFKVNVPNREVEPPASPKKVCLIDFDGFEVVRGGEVLQCVGDPLFNLDKSDGFDGADFDGFSVMGASIVVVPAFGALERIAGSHRRQTITANEQALKRGLRGFGMWPGFEQFLNLVEHGFGSDWRMGVFENLSFPAASAEICRACQLYMAVLNLRRITIPSKNVDGFTLCRCLFDREYCAPGIPGDEGNEQANIAHE